MADPTETFYDDEDDWEDDGSDQIEDDLEECGQGSDGSCLLAGTEHCYFACSYRDIYLSEAR